MAQIFRPRANAIAKGSILGILLLIGLGGWGWHALYWSSYTTGQGIPREQVVPFSHKHHVDGLGLDCRYCHTSVEESKFAGVPPTSTCMTCHSQIWTNAPVLEPVRQSWATGKRLRWRRVNDLPDFVFFNHGIHIAKGVGCATCHGQVEEMPLTWQNASLYMKWCLDCHRAPQKYLRPRDQVFNMNWTPPKDQIAEGLKLIQQYHIRTENLTDCSMCHR